MLAHYENLKREVIERKDSFDRFLAPLAGETTWHTPPASTRFHSAGEQGLLKHSLGVAETLLRFWETFASAITEESYVIIELLHDVGKLGAPSKPQYLPNDNKWIAKNRGMRYKIDPDVEWP